MNLKALRPLVLLATLAVVILATAAGCSQAAPSAVPTTVPAAAPKSDAKVKVGSIIDLTGPISPGISPAARGWADYWKYVNAEKGGVKGYQIEVVPWDSKYNMDQAMAGYARLKEAGVVTVLSAHSTFEEAIKPRLAEDNMSVVSPAGSVAALVPPGNIYFTFSTHFDKFLRAVDWIKANWKGANPPKLGAITTDNAYGRGFISDETLAYAKQQGIEWLGTEFIPLAPTDTSAQLLRMKEKGADLIYGSAQSSTWAPLVKDAAKLGLKDKMTFFNADLANLDFIQSAGDAANGVMGAEQHPQWDMSVPGVKLAAEIQKKYGQVEQKESYFFGMVSAIVAEKAIELALEKVTVDKLDGNAVAKNGYERISAFSPLGITSPLGFSPSDHRGAIDLRIWKIAGGKVTWADPAKRTADVFGLRK